MAEWSIQASVCGKRVAATAVGLFSVTPRQFWDILTLPEGAVIFRVQGRQLLSTDGRGKWEEQVVFTAPVRLLFWKPTTRTRVHQHIDASNAECITVDFRLLHSDLMSHLSGHWELKQLPPHQPGSPPVTRVTYSFQMWPKGVPTALRFMPGMLDAVKGAVKREAAQLLDKVYYVAQKVVPGVSVIQAVSAAAAEVQLAGGSFKLLQQALAADATISSSTSSSPHHTQAAAVALQPVSYTAAVAPMHSGVLCHALELDDMESEDQSEDDVLTHSKTAADTSRGRHKLSPAAAAAAAADSSGGEHMSLDTSSETDQEATDSSDMSSDIDADVLVGSSNGKVLAPGYVAAATPGWV